jgi:hypothetical protein
MINIPLLAVSQEVYTIVALFVILLLMEIQICQLRFRVKDLESKNKTKRQSPPRST